MSHQSMPALATIADLEIRLGVEQGSIEDEDLARAQAALADASALVRAEAGITWHNHGNNQNENVPEAVVMVTLRAAIRAYRNPEGLGSESLGGLYSYSYANGEAGVYLTPEEKRLVRNAALNVKPSGITTVRTPSNYYDPTEDLAYYIWWD